MQTGIAEQAWDPDGCSQLECTVSGTGTASCSTALYCITLQINYGCAKPTTVR